jgi:methionine-rich copper-binding protein CopC
MLGRRVLAAVLVLAALAICPPRLADAHALVVESSPRADEVLRVAPARIFLRFNSRLEGALSSITVTGPGGRPIPLPVAGAAPGGAPNELAASVPPLPPGQYLVRWKVLSADGHVTQGALRFTVAPEP